MKKAAAPQPFRPSVPTPASPPVYRPQPLPKVLQKKACVQPPPPQACRQPSAPPAYRPQPTPQTLQARTRPPVAVKAPGTAQLKPQPKTVQPKGVESGNRQAVRGRLPHPSGVVQRAIGFEYELGVWTSRKESSPNGVRSEYVTKGHVIWNDRGFAVTADQLSSGESDLEVVVKAVDDRPLGSRAHMATVLRSVVNLFAELKKRKGKGPFPATDLNPKADPSIYLDVPHGILAGQFQATAGLSLSALHAIRSGQTSQEITQSDAKSKLSTDEKEIRDAVLQNGGGSADPDIWQEVMHSMPGIRTSMNLSSTENLDNLASVISLMVAIPINTRLTEAEYPKAHSVSLLARTDYATIINLLPLSQQAALAKRPNIWARELTGLIERVVRKKIGKGAPKVSPYEPVFQHGSITHASTPRLSLEDWFKGVAWKKEKRVDLLTTANYPSYYPREEAKDLESLGGYGSKMDPGEYTRVRPGLGLVGPAMMALGGALGEQSTTGGGLLATGTVLTTENPLLVKHEERDRPIFEFRTLGTIAPDEMVEAGLGLWDYVDMAHGRSQSYLSASTGMRLWNLAASYL
jgi:hypothetical protein